MKIEDMLALLVEVGVLDERLDPSGELHRRWRHLQIAVEKNPLAVEKAKRDSIQIQDSAMIPAIVTFFPTGLHEKDIEIAFNHIRQRLDRIPAIPYKE